MSTLFFFWCESALGVFLKQFALNRFASILNEYAFCVCESALGVFLKQLAFALVIIVMITDMGNGSVYRESSKRGLVMLTPVYMSRLVCVSLLDILLSVNRVRPYQYRNIKCNFKKRKKKKGN